MRGPIFANIVLADEINRAPAKVQSALLEGMQEHRATIGPETLAFPEPFAVLATMNPFDGEGTYALPFAQLDRFLAKIVLGHPSRDEERTIVDRYAVPHRARRWRWPVYRARGRISKGAPSSPPTTCAPSRPRCCATG